MLLADGASTRSGIGVGDELGRVRQEYRRVTCGEAVAGGETPTYPWCRAMVGDDPIA